MKREDKTALIDELTEDMREHDTFFVADYRGLDMPSITELRQKLYGADARFRVAKNTLARIAAKNAGRDDLEAIFAGPTAIAFVKGDAAAVAKILADAGKDTDLLEVRGGMMDGSIVTGAQIGDIAKLPPREVILAMFVGALNAPLAQTVGVLSAPMRDIVGIIDAYIEKKQQEEAA